MVASKFSIVSSSLVNPQINLYMNIPNNKRPPNTTINIQHDHMLFQRNTGAPQSPFLSPMDSTPPSKENYAERMATISNRMDIKMSNPKITGPPLISPDNIPLHPPVHNKTASNTALQPDSSMLFTTS